MAMTKIEKQFVNRQRKAERNIEKVRRRLADLDSQRIHDVLEIGGGIGSVSAYLAETFRMQVYGTDFDPDQIELAQKLYGGNERLLYQIEDAAHLSFAHNSFDLVISQNVFHHIPDWPQAVKEIVRVLRPGGHLFWLDLVFPKLIKGLFQPIVKQYGLYTFADVSTEFRKQGLVEQFHERQWHGLFTQHHLVLQKVGSTS